MKIGLKLVVIFLCNMFIIALVSGQKGFQLGFGVGTMIMDYNTFSRGNLFKTVKTKSTDADFNDLKISGSNPVYIDVKLDYFLSPKFQIRSGVQYRYRTISYYGSNTGSVKMYSIPLIFNYRVPLSKEKGITLGCKWV
ncbi:MAG: hypothetical protein IPO92_09530 [Saprospiraceae bacterium]|nr:hypothetical protein [Saprospiraceae bacterium]